MFGALPPATLPSRAPSRRVRFARVSRLRLSLLTSRGFFITSSFCLLHCGTRERLASTMEVPSKVEIAPAGTPRCQARCGRRGRVQWPRAAEGGGGAEWEAEEIASRRGRKEGRGRRFSSGRRLASPEVRPPALT